MQRRKIVEAKGSTLWCLLAQKWSDARFHLVYPVRIIERFGYLGALGLATGSPIPVDIGTTRLCCCRLSQHTALAAYLRFECNGGSDGLSHPEPILSLAYTAHYLLLPRRAELRGHEARWDHLVISRTPPTSRACYIHNDRGRVRSESRAQSTYLWTGICVKHPRGGGLSFVYREAH